MGILNDAEIQAGLAELPGWEVKLGLLQREFTLPSFAHAVLFIGAIGQLSEAANHHPDLYLHSYKRLVVQLVTHSANGLTERDFNLARQIEALPQRQPKTQ